MVRTKGEPKDKAGKTGTPVVPGSIRADEVYGLAEFRKRTGLKEWAMRRLRREGLPVFKVGNRSFIRGRDFLRLLAQQKNRANGFVMVYYRD